MLYCDQTRRDKKRHYNILLVEDSEFINKTIFSFLSQETLYSLDQAYTFQEATDFLQEKEYHFIILDLNLPDAYGEELVDSIQRVTDAKIIVLTSEVDIQIRESLFKKGILDYLVKEKEFSFVTESIINSISVLEKNKNNTVLIVDDSMFMCKQLDRILKIRNYKVQIALNAQEALEKLQSSYISTIVLDMELPDKHGLEFLQEIRAMQQFCHIPVLVVSSTNNPETIRKALKTGASDFIKKPFIIEEFTLKVDLSVETHRRYVEAICSKNMVSEYKEAIDASSLVSKTDIHGNIIYANDVFCEVSGYTLEELLGSSHNIVRHLDMPSSVFKELWQTIQSKKIWKGVIKNRKKNGDVYYVKSTIKPILDVDGNILEYIAIRTDVTELEEYKEILKENLDISNNNLKYLQQQEEAVEEFIAVIKTSKDNTITYVNDNFLYLSGYTKDELIGMNVELLRSKKHIDKGECAKIANKLKNKEKISILFENITKDQKRYFVDTKIHPLIDKNGDVKEYLHLMYDVTEIVMIHKELENTQKEIIYTMGEIGESRSQETGKHVKRVAEYSYLLAILAGIDKKYAEILRSASPMHDIGKVAIPDSILKKPGKLTQEEFEVMKSHAEIGYKVLKNSKRPILKAAAIVAYTHHEKYDGSGYPRGLKEKEIHIFGRVTAIADVFDALGSDRVYKKGWELERILDLFKEEKGKHFDPKLVDLFLENIEKFLFIRDKFKDL